MSSKFENVGQHSARISRFRTTPTHPFRAKPFHRFSFCSACCNNPRKSARLQQERCAQNDSGRASLGQTDSLLPRERVGVNFYDLPSEFRRVVIRVVVFHANVDQVRHALEVLTQLVLLRNAHVIDDLGLHAKQGLTCKQERTSMSYETVQVTMQTRKQEKAKK